ncbi:MAG TPA: hypothetical protein VGC18_15940 [Lacisediminihabitans sp.]|uniref:hypothetical protein n=1 Tax=Lacisediminihabitans sp. TaxID=2787631 RepID=UPI002ED7FE7D
MTFLRIAVWILVPLVLLAAVALAVIAGRRHRPALALWCAAPVAIGLGAIVFGIVVPPPVHTLTVIAALAAAALGVVAGNPITVAVLDFADRGSGTASVMNGTHGGILVSEEGHESPQREVLRGGTTIGYLERLVVLTAVAVGHWEIVAALIAIKGLGRFSELDSPETRERFIIGTLVSLVWAGACAALFAF